MIEPELAFSALTALSLVPIHAMVTPHFAILAKAGIQKLFAVRETSDPIATLFYARKGRNGRSVRLSLSRCAVLLV